MKDAFNAPGTDAGLPAPDTLGQAVLDAIPAQIAVLDLSGNIIAVNLAWQLFAAENGGSPDLEHGVGLNYLDICRRAEGADAIEAQWIADGIAAVLEGRSGRFLYEYPCNSPDCERWFTIMAVPLRDSIAGAVLLHTDISAQKRAERESRKAREATAQAARLNAVGILAHSVVHELAQPLSAASFFSATAVALLERDGAQAKDLDKVLNGVDTQIKRAADIVQRLREFVRTRQIRKECVEVAEILVRALTLLRWFAKDKHVEIRLAHPMPSVTVNADSIQLEQVLVNLVSNSIHAIDAAQMQQREVLVALSLKQDQVEISVSDTGPGLPPDDSPDYLFDLFAPPKSAGLGMGLAISREIVEAHGGKLWAEQAPSGGAVFHFTLPLPAPIACT
jgi:signal transduction histidine kinase